MMKSLLSRLAAAAIGSAAAVAALAQTPSTPAVPAPAAVQPGIPASAAPQPAARWTAEQIRQAFDQADSDSDGQISRGEAQRLTILPRSFEDMDQNKDGVLVRREYEAGFSR